MCNICVDLLTVKMVLMFIETMVPEDNVLYT